MSSYLGLIHMLVPRRFEPVIVLRRVLDGFLNFSGDAASDSSEPVDQNDRVVEVLRLRHLLIGCRLADIFAGFGAVYLYARRRAGALTDQFAGEIEVGNASSLNAEIFHILYFAVRADRGACSQADEPVCQRHFYPRPIF